MKERKDEEALHIIDKSILLIDKINSSFSDCLLWSWSYLFKPETVAQIYKQPWDVKSRKVLNCVFLASSRFQIESRVTDPCQMLRRGKRRRCRQINCARFKVKNCPKLEEIRKINMKLVACHHRSSYRTRHCLLSTITFCAPQTKVLRNLLITQRFHFNRRFSTVTLDSLELVAFD